MVKLQRSQLEVMKSIDAHMAGINNELHLMRSALFHHLGFTLKDSSDVNDNAEQ